jgi:hypothetical protein
MRTISRSTGEVSGLTDNQSGAAHALASSIYIIIMCGEYSLTATLRFFNPSGLSKLPGYSHVVEV